MDTQGPAIRTGDLATKLNLKPGDIFEFTVRGERSEEEFSVDVNYDGLIDDIGEGDTVLVDNGVIHMKVLSKSGNRIRCELLTEGVMGSRRHINLPGVKVNLPPLTEKDLADVALGAELGVDFVALSFCREPGDITVLRNVLREHGSSARIVAKIEDQMAVHNLSGIIDATDAVMVARSGFESSFRYRSAVLFGQFTAVDDDTRAGYLQGLLDTFIPGRSAELRASTSRELAATLVLRLPIGADNWSVKIADGWPEDSDEDVAAGGWAGVVPVAMHYGDPLRAPDCDSSIPVPDSVKSMVGPVTNRLRG
jgi:nitroimidazol reductase NimA-like FMN-containing flavoprotein (pyridoxamine 5'-phosphate oxidase superfamily)